MESEGKEYDKLLASNPEEPEENTCENETKETCEKSYDGNKVSETEQLDDAMKDNNALLCESNKEQNINCTEKHPDDEIIEKSVALDDLLPQINEFGRYQKLMMGFLSALLVPLAYQPFLTTFLQSSPSWSCIAGHPQCNSTESFAAGKHEELRCSLNRSAWKFDRPLTYSIVTEWDLICKYKWYPFIASSLFFVGQLIGQIMAGYVFDRYGRRIVIWQSFFLCLLFCFVASFVPSFWWFALMRLLVGVAYSFQPIYICAVEMVGPRYRNFTGVFIWVFFTLSMVAIAFQAWLIQDSWRTLSIVLCAPYIVLLPGFRYFPESVRWLLVNGKVRKAEDILRKVAKVNKRVYPRVKLEVAADAKGSKEVSLKHVFVPWRVGVSTLLQSFIWIVNALVYYGISLAVGSLSGNIYRDFVFISIVEIPSYILLVKTSKRFGRKPSTMIPLIITGLCCICMAFLQDKSNPAIRWARVGFGIVGKFNVTISYSAVILWTSELMPTVVRSRGYTVTRVLSRLGAAGSPWVSMALGRVHPYLPFTTMGVLGLIGGACCYFLRETNGEKSNEVIEDITDKTSKMEMDQNV